MPQEFPDTLSFRPCQERGRQNPAPPADESLGGRGQAIKGTLRAIVLLRGPAAPGNPAFDNSISGEYHGETMANDSVSPPGEEASFQVEIVFSRRIRNV